MTNLSPEALKELNNMFNLAGIDYLKSVKLKKKVQAWASHLVEQARKDELQHLAQNTNSLVQGTYGVTSKELAYRLAVNYLIQIRRESR